MVGFKVKNGKIFKSFKYAINGLLYSFKSERNIKIHFLVALLVLLLSYFLEFTKTEILILIITISIVIITEMINTAIEQVIDMASNSQYHPLAKIAKDVAAGAVLIAAINAIIVGCILIFKKV